MVKFVSPAEFYDWFLTNFEEIKEFKELHDDSIGIWHREIKSHAVKIRYRGRLLRTGEELQDRPRGELLSPPLLGWNKVNCPANEIQDYFQEDEIYIVTSIPSFLHRKTEWWAMYIPIPMYKTNIDIGNPFTKEAWESGGSQVDLSWISGFIQYIPSWRGVLMNPSLNYPRGIQ